jgi:hypothetical protein
VERVAASVAERGHRLPVRFVLHVRHHDRRALVRESFREGAADPARGAGDEGHPSLQSPHLVSFRLAET